MLAIGRALVLNPRLLLLDEPTEGLAPIIVDELLAALRELSRAGLSMIIVEQKPKKILPFTDHAIVLDRGAIAHAAPSAELLADPAALDAHLTAARKAAAIGAAVYLRRLLPRRRHADPNEPREIRRLVRGFRLFARCAHAP